MRRVGSLPLPLVMGQISGALAMTLTAGLDWRTATVVLAGLAVLGFVAAAIGGHARLRRRGGGGGGGGGESRAAAMLDAELSALAWGWGAAAMACMYYLTPLAWYHAYQYAGAMALLALLALILRSALALAPNARRLRKRLVWSKLAAIAQLLLAVIGTAALLVSGKVWLGRSDWAANTVFIAGGIVLAVLAVLALPALASHKRATKRTP